MRVGGGGGEDPREKYEQPSFLIVLGRKYKMKSTGQHKQINKIQVHSHGFHMTSNLDHGPDYLQRLMKHKGIAY